MNKTEFNRIWQAQPAMRAFTLVEVMISIALFGMILTAIYSSWSSILRGSRVGQEAAEQIQEIRVTLSCLNQSLTGAQIFNANEIFYSFEGYSEGDSSSLSFVSNLSESFLGSGFFPGEPVRRVSFYVGKSESGTAQLFMQQSPVLVDQESDFEPYTVGLAEGVTFFEALFWSEQEEDWMFEWVETNQMPKMVQLRLGLELSAGRSGKVVRTYSKLIAIPATAIQEEWQRPTAGAGGAAGGRLTPAGRPGANRPGVPSGNLNLPNPSLNLNGSR